jgi:hypothetical protein
MRFAMHAVISFASSVFLVVEASATEYTWQGDDLVNPATWSDPDNWTPGGGPPGSSDTAIIADTAVPPHVTSSTTVGFVDVNADSITVLPGVTFTIAGESGLTIATGTFLDLSASARLQITGGGDHQVDGDVNLIGDYSTIEILDCDAGLYGVGRILSEIYEEAAINIEAGVTFTLILDTTPSPDEPFDVEGALEITGSGSFVNNGKVWANATGVLLIGETLASISGLGTWEASGDTDAILRFGGVDTGCGLTGRFVLKGGATFQFLGDADIQTTNSINTSNWCGTVDVAEGGSLTLDCDGSPTVISTDTVFDDGC